MSDTMYFIRRESDKSIKIGVTTNLRRRVSDLRRLHGELTVVGVVDGNENHEKVTHFLFSGSRLDGEFFELTPELEEFIEKHASAPPPSVRAIPRGSRDDRRSNDRPWIDQYANPGVVIQRDDLVSDYRGWIDDGLVAVGKEHALGIIETFPEKVVYRPQPGKKKWGMSPLNPRCWVDESGQRLYQGG